MNTKTIKSDAIYPSEGRATVARTYCRAEWPALDAGDKVEILDHQGWVWDGEVVEMVSPDKFEAKVAGKRPSPMPAVEDGGVVLSNVSGHAHVRNWVTGSVVEVHGEYYKVSGKPKLLHGGSKISYGLKPATQKKWDSRPGRVEAHSEQAAREMVGSAVQTKTGEWLHVTEVKFRRFHGALGSDRVFSGHGKHVSAKKAEALNAVHPKTLSKDLHSAESQVSQQAVMPEGAKVLIAENSSSLAATGERVALSGKVVLHERVGDPDQSDCWRHYVVEIKDKALVARVKKFLAKKA